MSISSLRPLPAFCCVCFFIFLDLFSVASALSFLLYFLLRTFPVCPRVSSSRVTLLPLCFCFLGFFSFFFFLFYFCFPLFFLVDWLPSRLVSSVDVAVCAGVPCNSRYSPLDIPALAMLQPQYQLKSAMCVCFQLRIINFHG